MNESWASPVVVLVVYCGLILLASLAGGWIPLFVRLTHTRLQVAISFVAGLMLGVGLLHLLPHAWQQLRSIDRAVSWLLGGFLVMFFIQRFFHFHHHDVPDDARQSAGREVEHEGQEPRHAPEGPPLAEQSARRLSWTGAMLGLTLHSLIDGIALAASAQVESHADRRGWMVGLGTFLVIVLHKPFDAMAVGTLMARSVQSRVSRHLVNSLFGMVTPLGVLLFYFGAGRFSGAAEHFVGAALAFTAGTFLCIATSDLLPELQFHAHDRLKLSFALLGGLAISALIGRFEESGHDWHQPPSAGRESAGVSANREVVRSVGSSLFLKPDSATHRSQQSQ